MRGNKKKLLTVILIVQAVVLVGAIVASVFLLPSLWNPKKTESAGPITVINGTDSDKYNGYADVTLYGAVADDGKDDTEAFTNAAATGAGVYVPLGTYDIKETVAINGQDLKGAGIDRTVIRMSGEGAIVKTKGAAIIEDITLSFAEGSITGDEAEGEKVAVYDDGITAGSMLRAVKLANVGTGYYSKNSYTSNVSLLIESVVIDEFSHAAVRMKDVRSTTIRTVNIGKTIGDVDAALSIGGAFTLDAVTFSGTKCNYPILFDSCRSAVINSVIFSGVEAESGSFIKSVSSVISMKTVTAVNSKASTLLKIEDNADGIETSGNVISLWSDSPLSVDEGGKIACQSNISK